MTMAQRGVLGIMRKLGSGTKFAGVHNRRTLSNHLWGASHNISDRITVFRQKSACQLCERSYSTESTKKAASPEILSKLFPQTALNVDEETERERKRKDEEEAKENEKAWKRMKIGFGVFGGSGIALVVWAVYEFGKPEVDAEGQVIEDEFSKSPAVQQYIQRMWKSLNYYQKMIQEPSRDKLLPDPLKPPYVQPPYTLVLEMKDVLVHPDWTYQTGWRFKKRPGVDQFLQECAKNFEIVVFTAEQGMTVFPILDALDPNGCIMYRLVRDATHFVDGHHVKNLDNLNRDLKKVIVVDWDQNATKMHPDNTFNIARWLGNDDDTQLLDLISFLKTLVAAEVEDVRDVLHYYQQFEDPIAQFRENQRLLLEQMQEKEREEQTKQKPIVKKWTPSFLGRSS
ncbi:mitochondrial import inner membrane translocase subunit TIM50-C [Rhagoletis pomonella]|uniref:mitochondrial import inner membrane translocase subunit TIM50-C n=1 Tax=Rhagoletis pomonella TaxID=28610 RepID=UPI001780213E|nr:mitochondrial import inner membrane translocase subunit TIM50-C [Rhagoletis pomonella]